MPTRAVLGVVCALSLLLTTQAWAQDESKTEASPAAAENQDPAPSSAEGSTPAAPSAPEAGAPVAVQSTGAQVPAGGSVRLKALEQRVNELKEKIFRSKARLNLLKETVLHGVIAGSRAIIKHQNEMGSSYKLIKLVYAVDGAQIYTKADESGALSEKKSFEVFNGSIVPGDHTVSVRMEFRGDGYGIFSYLNGYSFNIRASHTFTAAEGRQLMLTVRSYEKGNVTTDFEQRPAVKFESSLYKVGTGAADTNKKEDSQAPAPAASEAPAAATGTAEASQ